MGLSVSFLFVEAFNLWTYSSHMVEHRSQISLRSSLSLLVLGACSIAGAGVSMLFYTNELPKLEGGEDGAGPARSYWLAKRIITITELSMVFTLTWSLLTFTEWDLYSSRPERLAPSMECAEFRCCPRSSSPSSCSS